MSRPTNDLDLEQLRQRSRVDDETGCWLLRAPRRNGTTYLWLPQAGKPMSLTAAMGWLLTGNPAPRGWMWVASCGNTGCCNPAHRALGTRSMLMKVLRPQLDPLHRARIARAHQARSRHFSPALRTEILCSPETDTALGRRLGLHPTTVARIRAGKAWRPAAPGASVFSMGATS